MDAIDISVVNDLQLPWENKEEPYYTYSIGGQRVDPNDEGTLYKTNIPLTVDGKQMEYTFDIMDIGQHEIVLGYPWLQKYNPIID